MLNGSFGMRGFFEYGSETSSSHHFRNTNYSSEGERGMNYGSPIVRGVNVGPFYPTQPSVNPEPIKVSRDQRRTHYFINSIREVNNQDPSDREVKDHIDF